MFYIRRICVVLFILIGLTFAQDVYWEPNSPLQGDQVTIYYHLENRDVLPYSTNPVYLHLGFDGWNSTTDYAMNEGMGGYWEYSLNIPQNVSSIDFAFTNTNNPDNYSTAPWDNNGGHGEDWEIEVYAEGLSVVVVSPEVENPYNNIFRTPTIIAHNEVLPLVFTTVTTSAPADSLYLLINGTEVSKSNNDTLKYDFDTSAYPAENYTVLCIGKDIAGIRDTTKFAIVVRPQQNSMTPPSGIKPGINYSDTGTITLAIFAPYKEYVYVVGEFNDWQVDNLYLMNKYEAEVDSTFWWLVLPVSTNGAFQYLVDGEIRVADPYTELVLDQWNDKYISSTTFQNIPEYPHNKTDHPVSVIQGNQEEYQWQNDSNFIKPEKKDLVIYELLIRDFVESHNYQTLIDTLDYIENLGINAIDLMPINEFEGNSSWGYNSSFYFAPDKYYGTKNDLKMFIDECHKRNIAVIQDIVLNHSYGQSPLVRLYWDDVNNRPAENNPWYNKKSPNPVYSWGYDFNHKSEHTNAFVDRVLRYWIEDIKVDGFRLDFTKGFTNTGGDGGQYDASRIAILERIADKVWSCDSTSYLILEHFADNVEEKELANYGFLLWGNANFNYNEATMGYNSNSDFSWGFYKQRGWTKPHLVTYMESHDEERLMYKNLNFGNSSGNYNVKDLATALDRQKLAAAFYFTLPGPKMIWQFGELGYDYSIDFNGRVGEKPIRWDYFSDPNRKELYDLYSNFLKLRNENEVFRSSQTSVELDLNNSNGLKRIGLTGSMNVIIIGNFGVETQSINPNFYYSDTWFDDINSDSLIIEDTQATIELKPGEFRVFSNRHFIGYEPDPIEPPIYNYQFDLFQNFPNPFNASTSINYSISKNEIGIDEKVTLKLYNVLGEEIAVLIDEVKPSGEYQLNFNRNGLSNGLYLYTLTYGNKVLTKKMLLLK